jgi:cadmium resistance protein CadD (predicted permease)
MTKKTIRKWFIGAIIAFILLLIVGIVISIFDCSRDRIVFSTFKDLLPLFLGIAAVWLGYCVQRRNAYQQQLRSLWSKLIEAVHYAIQYSCLDSPTQEQYSTVLAKLSIAIDEVRGGGCPTCR